MRARQLLLGILVLMLLVSCGVSDQEPEGEGVQGRVWVRPPCAEAQDEEDCSERPYQTKLEVRDIGGDLVAQTESGKDGFFRVLLPPGKYILVPKRVSEDDPFQALPISFEVFPDDWVEITVIYTTKSP